VAGRLPARKKLATFDGRPWFAKLVLITSKRTEKVGCSLPAADAGPGQEENYQFLINFQPEIDRI
jgi:hypothetical protein